MTGIVREKCHTFLLMMSKKIMFIIAKKKCHYWGAFWQRTGSWRQSVVMQQQKTNRAASFLIFTQFFPPFFQYSAAPSQIPCRWPGHNASQTWSSQYGGYKIDVNTDRGSCKRVCTSELVSVNPFSGSSTTGHLFILQRQRNINGFIKVCFPPADCCDQTMWKTNEIFKEKNDSINTKMLEANTSMNRTTSQLSAFASY